MSSFGHDLIVEVLGAAVGAGVGGWVSYKIAKFTFNKETGREIARLLLELRNNRQRIYDIYSKVVELRTKQLSQEVFKKRVSEIISDVGNSMQPVYKLWEEQSSLIYLEYSGQEYIQIQDAVNKVEEITKQISNMNKGGSGRVFVDLENDAFANAIDDRYKELERLFEAITNKSIKSKLRIKK